MRGVLRSPCYPLLTQGMRLSMEEIEEAYATLEDYIIFQVMGDSNEALGYAVGKINKFYHCEDTGAHIELTYLGCENEFYRWYIEHEGEPGGLPKNYSHHLCRCALSICMRKEGRKVTHVQRRCPYNPGLLGLHSYTGIAEVARKPPLKRQLPRGSVTGCAAKSRALRKEPSGTQPLEDEVMDVEEEDDECVPEVTKQKKKRGRGSAGRALETAND